MIASPPIETAVDCPRPAAESVLQISVVMPPERDMTPIGPFLKARRTFTAGPPRPPILASSGERMPRQLGPMMAAEAAHLGFLGREDAEAVGADDARAAQAGELHHLRHLAARDALGDDHDELHARLDGLEDGVTREARRHGHDRAVDVLPRGDVPYAVVDGHAVHVAPGPAGRDAAHDLRPVVEALARQVHRLAPGDALDDDRRIPVDEDGHQPFILATARPAASYRDTVRSQYSTPYLRRIVNPSSSHAPGMRKMAIVSAGLRPASTQPLITPRATMSTRVLETTFIMTAIFFTPGFERMSLVSSHAFLTLGLPPISQ